METAEYFFNLGVQIAEKDPRKAIEHYKKATELDPSFVDAYNSWGNALLALGEAEKAREKYHKCLELDKTYYIAYYNLGVSYESSDVEVAIENYKKAIEINDHYFNAHYNHGILLYNREDYKEAREKFKTCVDINPQSKEAQYRLGLAYDTEYPKSAIKHYKKAVNLDNKYIDAIYGWGSALNSLGEYEKAIAKYKECTQIDDNYILAINAWGNALLNSGKIKKALKKYRKCLELNSDYQWAHYNIGRCFENTDPKEASKHFEKAVKINPKYTAAHLALGNALLDMGDSLGARERYQKCIEIDQNYKVAHYNIGVTYLGEDFKKAITYFKKALEIDNKYLSAYSAWGNALVSLDKRKEAREKYKQALSIDPKNITAINGMGFSYMHEDPLQAISHFKESIELNPDDTGVYNDYYFCLLLLEEKDAEIKTFEKIVREKRTAPGLHILGNLYQYHFKDYDTSLELYNLSSKLGGSTDLCLDISNVYDSRSDLEKALKALNAECAKKSNEIYPQHNEAHYLFKMGHYDRSREIWKEVINKYETALK